MIAYLQGKIITKEDNALVVFAGGIGYRVFVSVRVLEKARAGQEISLYTHHHKRENEESLYGFATENEWRFFGLLLTVSGIGPKSALAVLASAPVEELAALIAQGDPVLLGQASGLGAKTSAKLVAELKDKAAKFAGRRGVSGDSVAGDEIEALMNLGYSFNQAREALKSVDRAITDSGERIRQALRKVG